MQFWKTWKGQALAAYVAAGAVISIVFDEPVITYAWPLLLGSLALSVLPVVYLLCFVRKGPSWEKRTRISQLSLLLLAFGILGLISFLVIGWPLLRFASIAADRLDGDQSSKTMTLTGYERASHGKYSPLCNYKLRLSDTTADLKHFVCADAIRIDGLSETDLSTVSTKPPGIPVEVLIKTSVGVSLVKAVKPHLNRSH